MNASTGMDYYAYTLLDPRSQGADLLKAAASTRPVSGANQRAEEEFYLRALGQAVKTVDQTVTRSVVVAHCDENLDWLSRLDPSLKQFVYSKGKNQQGIPLPNVGRDYGTYLYHIIHNYEDLTDVVFFLQGWPLDRSAHVITGVNHLRHFNFIEFGTDILETGPIGQQLIDFYNFVFDTRLTVNSVKPWAFRANTQFGASRAVLHRRIPSFFSRCLKACEEGVPSCNISPESVPYLFEQIWHFIFGPYQLC